MFMTMRRLFRWSFTPNLNLNRNLNLNPNLNPNPNPLKSGEDYD